jgi:hypothetical protein
MPRMDHKIAPSTATGTNDQIMTGIEVAIWRRVVRCHRRRDYSRVKAFPRPVSTIRLIGTHGLPPAHTSPAQCVVTQLRNGASASIRRVGTPSQHQADLWSRLARRSRRSVYSQKLAKTSFTCG